MSAWLEPVVLAGTTVRLEPMAPRHAPEILAVGRHPELWQYMTSRVETLEDAEAVLRHAQQHAERETGVGFVQRALDDGRVVGGTGYWNADPEHRRVEIGFTWITPDRQRTSVNTETKLLMLTHAFETLGCIRVEFKTDARNTRSRTALERIGAVQEGIHRRHMIMRDGMYRDSVYYSITDEEWPGVQERLSARLGAGETPKRRNAETPK